LLPLVYDELRRLASQRLAQEKPGQTLQATALVHEAYLRLLGPAQAEQSWNSRGHFFVAAAEAMRRIVVERARRKRSLKQGGDWQRIELHDGLVVAEDSASRFVALDEALTSLEQADPVVAKLVKLRYFAGLTMPEAAQALEISLRTAERNWTYARTWLHREISQAESPDSGPIAHNPCMSSCAIG
jgi:RNA polymerase sigma factor (TIGR02999 family)